MLVVNKKAFNRGALLGVSFLIVLAIMFMPIFGEGRNAFRAADRFYNSIAKGSTYYIPHVMEQNEEFKGRQIDVAIQLDNEEMVRNAAQLFEAGGASVAAEGTELRVSGDLGRILSEAISQADLVFHNRGEEIAQRFGFSQREALYVWHKSLKAVNKALTKQENFKEAAWIEEALKRTVEVAYNFYKIEPRSASSAALMLSVSLGFYVIYTLWWGYAILNLFEGFGLEMKAGHKKEV